MGSISSCFYTRNSKIEALQKILVVEDLQKILAEKWAAFPPVLTRKMVKSKTCKKFSQKNGQHFPLFLRKFNKKKILSYVPVLVADVHGL